MNLQRGFQVLIGTQELSSLEQMAPAVLTQAFTVNIYMYKTIQARVNTVAIPTTGKCCSLYWELLHPILGIPLASIGKLPFIGKLPIEA